MKFGFRSRGVPGSSSGIREICTSFGRLSRAFAFREIRTSFARGSGPSLCLWRILHFTVRISFVRRELPWRSPFASSGLHSPPGPCFRLSRISHFVRAAWAAPVVRHSLVSHFVWATRVAWAFAILQLRFSYALRGLLRAFAFHELRTSFPRSPSHLPASPLPFPKSRLLPSCVCPSLDACLLLPLPFSSWTMRSSILRRWTAF